MSSKDKIICIALAAGLAVLYFANVINGTVAIVLGIIAGVFVLTSFISFCPLYLQFTISIFKKLK